MYQESGHDVIPPKTLNDRTGMPLSWCTYELEVTDRAQ
jgi:hypothetical protein